MEVLRQSEPDGQSDRPEGQTHDDPGGVHERDLPSTPCAAKRWRHRITVGRDIPSSDAIALLDTPWAALSTMRARAARPSAASSARARAVSLQQVARGISRVARSATRDANIFKDIPYYQDTSDTDHQEETTVGRGKRDRPREPHHEKLAGFHPRIHAPAMTTENQIMIAARSELPLQSRGRLASAR